MGPLIPVAAVLCFLFGVAQKKRFDHSYYSVWGATVGGANRSDAFGRLLDVLKATPGVMDPFVYDVKNDSSGTQTQASVSFMFDPKILSRIPTTMTAYDMSISAYGDTFDLVLKKVEDRS